MFFYKTVFLAGILLTATTAFSDQWQDLEAEMESTPFTTIEEMRRFRDRVRVENSHIPLSENETKENLHRIYRRIDQAIVLCDGTEAIDRIDSQGRIQPKGFLVRYKIGNLQKLFGEVKSRKHFWQSTVKFNPGPCMKAFNPYPEYIGTSPKAPKRRRDDAHGRSS